MHATKPDKAEAGQRHNGMQALQNPSQPDPDTHTHTNVEVMAKASPSQSILQPTLLQWQWHRVPSVLVKSMIQRVSSTSPRVPQHTKMWENASLLRDGADDIIINKNSLLLLPGGVACY